MLFVDHYPNFKALHHPFLEAKTDDFLFCYQNKKIGLLPDNQVPRVGDLIEGLSQEKLFCFARINQHNCFLWNGSAAASKLNFIEIRPSCSLLAPEFQQAVVLGNYLFHWREMNRYCGKCGTTMRDGQKERTRICPDCQHTIYPRISPCIMALVTRGEQMLLAHSPHFLPNMFSVLAGFVNLGETVEQALVREVKEEVGIEIDNCEYVCSQPWLFPDSLLLGFTAKYAAGDIVVDKIEIESAAWFDRDNLPQLPTPISLARYLIERHLRR